MRNTRTGAVVSLACALATAAAATETGSAVDEVLARVADHARVEHPLRAAGTIRIGGGASDDQPLVLLFRPEDEGRSVLLALPEAKLRLLVQASGEAHLAADGEVTRATLATEIGETRLRVEDLLPLDPKRCMGIHVVDAAVTSLTLRCDPAKGTGTAYALTVWKLGRESGTTEQVLYYQGTTSNLVKRLQPGEWTEIGGKRRPRRVVVQDYAIGARNVLALEWTEPGTLDGALFDVGSFATAPIER